MLFSISRQKNGLACLPWKEGTVDARLGVVLKAAELQGKYLNLFKESVTVQIDNQEMKARQQRLLDTLERLADRSTVRRPKKIATGSMRRLTQKQIAMPVEENEVIDVEPQ